MSASTDRQLAWAKRLAAIAQTGLTFTEGVYDRERYDQIRAVAAEMLADAGRADESPSDDASADARAAAIVDVLGRENGYATPKVDVRGVVFRGDAILLVQEAEDGAWTLPGGWADVGDAPSRNVEREIREEAGLVAKATRLLAVYDRDNPRHGHPPHPYHIFKLFFLCEPVDATAAPSASHETTAAAFFRRDPLPPLSLTRTTPSQVRRMFELRDHPDAPADFD